MARIIKIPCDESLPLVEEKIIAPHRYHSRDHAGDDGDDETDDGSPTPSPSPLDDRRGGDAIPAYLLSRSKAKAKEEEEASTAGSDDERNGHAAAAAAAVIVDATPLIRMTHPSSSSPAAHSADCNDSLAGLYAYWISSTSVAIASQSSAPNVRATRLAMACGLHSRRFVGDVWIGRLGHLQHHHHHHRVLTNLDTALSDIEAGARYSPDLRDGIVRGVVARMQQDEKGVVCGDGSDGGGIIAPRVPAWLGDAPRKNYHDGGSLAALASAMTRADVHDDDDDDDDDASSASAASSGDDSSSFPSSEEEKDEDEEGGRARDSDNDDDDIAVGQLNASLTETTLCLHCRRPASALCDGCGGAYFCEEPRKCKTDGWSHLCLCPTWKIYVERRGRLSSFPYLSGWHLPLLGEDCFASETAYRHFLTDVLGVVEEEPAESSSATTGPFSDDDDRVRLRNWWTTELHGWSGGAGASSRDVDPYRRTSYRDGFALGHDAWIPEERRVAREDVDRANAAFRKDSPTVDDDDGDDDDDNHDDNLVIRIDERGLPVLTSWEHYYRLRSLPPSSPVGLLATFPLTIYYAIQHYGAVPLEVSRLLERPLRIHVVGIEKEMNFVDLFKEVGYLLPEDVSVDMTWIVREDMFPENGGGGGGDDDERRWRPSLSLRLTANLGLSIIGGTYGQSLDPDFDVAGGPPDMVIGMNAGLYAYESWRHVISYLHHHRNVLGVFTDYNEHSGMNCASLGGWKSANSLEVNPFRQMRAMPVYCMNLPQFSNGFFYIFNEQDFDG